MLSAALPISQAPTLLFEDTPGATEATRDVSPFLIPFHPANVRVTALLSKCSGWPMISAIETRESQAELSERLAAWTVVAVDSQHWNFRFPDTRRLPAIFDVLTTRQRTEFAGPATRWSFIDRNGDWASLAVPGMPGVVAERPELDEQQFAQLVRASEVDEALSLLRHRGQAMPRLHSQCYATVSLALRVANKEKLDEMSKLNWCESCLREGLPQDVIQATARLAQWMSQQSSELLTN
jgi:hypothetical protein